MDCTANSALDGVGLSESLRYSLRMRFRFGPVLLAVVLAGLSGAQPTLTPAERQLNIDSFEQVWKTVRDKHWDPKLNGVDWQAIHDELGPKVEKAATLDEARGVMSDMLGRLKQTHFGIDHGAAYREMGSAAADDDSRVHHRRPFPVHWYALRPGMVT